MIALLLALAIGPVAQEAPPAEPAPTSAVSGDLTVAEGGMMAWSSGGRLGGQVSVVVENSGPDADRVVSISTPAGPVGRIGVYPIVNGRGTRAPEGDLTIAPGRTGVLAELDDLASGAPAPVLTTVTVVFERAGAVTVRAQPVSPAPAPPAPVPTPRH